MGPAMGCSWTAWAWALLLAAGAAGAAQPPAPPRYVITRHLEGDVYTAASGQRCPGQCGPGSGGTALDVPGSECSCQCLPGLPIFRDDLHVCVDDIHECSLVPFVSGTTSQTVPFVFLPLKGQIVFPSAEIQFPGNSSPICVVSGARFLAKAGWVDMRNHSDTEPPLRLLRDNGRNYLQWLGEPPLRRSMEGRLLLVQLMCKEEQSFFTPCVALRVAGTPSSFSGVREVSFSPVSGGAGSGTGDAWASASLGAGWLVGASGGLLGLAYVLAALLYMRTRRRKNNKKRERQLAGVAAARMEEGSGRDNGAYLASSSASSSCCSDSADETPASDSGMSDRRLDLAPHALVSVVVHGSPNTDHYLLQDTAGIERLPEEDVSIVETLDVERPDAVRAMAGPPRRKLYFNPAYFDPELLAAPPPAALEFLSKIREVISIAKHKMAAKRFAPSLVQIPEEESLSSAGPAARVASLKEWPRVASRPSRPPSPPVPPPAAVSGRAVAVAAASACPGCPGCTASQLPPAPPLGPPLPLGCNVCAGGPHSKQHHIRKWLEEVRAPRSGELDDSGSVKSEGSVYGPVTPLRPMAPRPGGGSFRQPGSADGTRVADGDGGSARAAGRRKSAPRTPAKYMLENMRAARLGALALEAESAASSAAPPQAAEPLVKGLPPKVPLRNANAKNPAAKPEDAAPCRLMSEDNSFRSSSVSSEAVERLAAHTGRARAGSINVSIRNKLNAEAVGGVESRARSNSMSGPSGPSPGAPRAARPTDASTGFRARSASVTNRVRVSAEEAIVRRNAMHSPPPPPPSSSPTSPTPPPGLLAQQKEAIARKLSDSAVPPALPPFGPARSRAIPSPPPPPPTSAPLDKPEVPKQLMDAVIKELVVQRGLETVAPKPSTSKPPSQPPSQPASLGADVGQGASTPSEYGEVPPHATLQPGDFQAQRALAHGLRKLQQQKAPAKPAPPEDDNEYEIIVLSPEPPTLVEAKDKDKAPLSLPNFLTNSEGYSLVSEVYVNDSYSFSSSAASGGSSGGASPSPSHSSASAASEKNIKYSDKQPGHLTIQVDDPPENKRRVPEDNFEPDTLDRKSITRVREVAPEGRGHGPLHDAYVDSLERPSGPQSIFLRTAGSFRSADPPSLPALPLQHLPACSNHRAHAAGHAGHLPVDPSPFSRFGSLREIYESRARCRAMDTAVNGHSGPCSQSLHGGSLHGGSLHGGSLHGGSLHGGSLHGGSLHGGSLHGGSLHGGSQYSDTDCTSVASSRRSARSARSAQTTASSTRASAKHRHRQRNPSPPPSRSATKSGSSKRSARKAKAPAALPAPPRPPKPKPHTLYEEPPPPRPVNGHSERDPSPMRPDRPPLPPRNPKPALPPKQSSSKRQQNPAHRPLPPLPHPLPPLPPRAPHGDGTRDDDDAMSAASVDSLNSSDYEAFYSMPSASPPPCVQGQFILARPSASAASSPVPRRKQRDHHRDKEDACSEKAASFSGSTFLQETQLLGGSRGRVSKDLVRHLRDKRGSDSVKKSWRKVNSMPIQCPVPPHKPEDSGYLSTDSNESRRRLSLGHSNGHGLGLGKGPSQGSLSETDGDESLCDGASESGGESVATDSFFFGSFRGTNGSLCGGSSADRRRGGSRRSSVVTDRQTD